MKKIFFKYILFFAPALIILSGSCKKENKSVPLIPVIVTNQSFIQSFDSMSAAEAQGWKFKNLSDDAANGWSVADSSSDGIMPFDGTGFLYSDYNASSTVEGSISNWAISPALFMQNGDKISFYTRSRGTSDGYGDRLQLRLNIFNSSDSIGKSSSDIGHFTTPLVDVNPLYKITSPGDYPTEWTKYEGIIQGLNKPDSGRFALRYFVELNGGSNGDEIAVDKVEFKTAGF